MNLGTKALQILKTVAPMIGTAIGGPFGAIAGTLLSSALGTSSSSDTETALLAANPAQLVAVKQAELTFKQHMADLQISEDQLVFADVASARSMQVATRANTPGQLAWLVIGGFMVVSIFECVAMVCWPASWAAIPGAALNVLGMIFGFLANESKQAGSFYFGGTAAGASSNQALADIAKSS
jgi:hypothetical protein